MALTDVVRGSSSENLYQELNLGNWKEKFHVSVTAIFTSIISPLYIHIMSVLNYMPRMPSCLCYLHVFLSWRALCTFIFSCAFIFMSALHALIFYVPWVFLRALRVSIFIRALLTLIFHLPYVPSSFTCLPCLFFRCLYFIYVLLRFLYTFIFLKCAYYLLCALSYSRTLLVFIFHNPNGGH